MKMTIKKKIFLIILACSCIIIFACGKSASSDESSSGTTNFVDGVYQLRNPETNSTMVVKGDGTVLIKAINPMNEEVNVIEDMRTHKVNFIYKTFSGEKLRISTYSFIEEGEETTEITKDVSQRCVIYDKDGNDIGLELQTYAPYRTLNDYIFYYLYGNNDADENNLKIYDAKSKKEIKAPHRQIDFYGDHIIFSADAYTQNDLPKEILVVDDTLNVIKSIPGYTSLSTMKFGDVTMLKVMKGENNYNFLDKNYNIVFDMPVETNTFENDSHIVTLHSGDIEFDYDFKNMKKVSEDRPYININKWEVRQAVKEKYKDISEEIKALDSKYKFVDTFIYDDKVLFQASYSNEDPKNWRDRADIYNSEKELLKSIDFVNMINEDVGHVFANYDTFYDFDMNLLKHFDEKSTFQLVDWNGKYYYINNCDADYNQKDKYNMYDLNFNIVFENISGVDKYTFKDKLIITDDTGTNIYDKDFELIKKLDRRFEFRNWWQSKNFAFVDKDTGLMGVCDRDFNILVDNLKRVDNLKDNYFTYQNGFKYGFMDYSGKPLLTFSIFDTMTEDSVREDYEGNFVE